MSNPNPQFCRDCVHEVDRRCTAKRGYIPDIVRVRRWQNWAVDYDDKRKGLVGCPDYKRVWWKFWRSK